MAPTFKSRRQEKIWLRQKRQVEEKKKSAKTYVNQAPFRYAERNFKSRMPPPDFSDVLDFDELGQSTEEKYKTVVPVPLTHDLRKLSNVFGESDTPCQQAYILKNVPGLIIIPNAITPKAQRKLIKQCLADYPRAPNTSNLHTHYEMPESGLWPLYTAQESGQLKPEDPGFYVQKKLVVDSDVDSDTYSDSEQEDDKPACTNPTACSDEFSPIVNTPKPDPKPAPGVPLLSPSELVRKLRWITLGYQYHWPTKTYHLDRRYPFPADVSDLTKAVVTAVEGIGYDDGQEPWKNTYRGADFNAEAGVINYYQFRDTLMGHVDRSELNMDAPLVSLSLGHSCIYLIGGLTRETVPIPLLLKSGDIIVMTGPCRKAFHGVPLIIEDTLPEYLSNNHEYEDAPDWKLYGDFMSTSRINLNIRQVYPK